jgi:hypothetical protein
MALGWSHTDRFDPQLGDRLLISTAQAAQVSMLGDQAARTPIA